MSTWIWRYRNAFYYYLFLLKGKAKEARKKLEINQQKKPSKFGLCACLKAKILYHLQQKLVKNLAKL